MGRKNLSDVRRTEILEAFYRCLIRHGLEGSTVAGVAQEAGISPGLVIHYFSTKDEMTVALVDLILRRYEETFLPRLEGIDEPGDRLKAIMDTVFSQEWGGLVDPGVFAACYSLSFRNERVGDSFRKMYSRLREILTEELRSLMEGGVIVDSDPSRLADLVIALLEGYDVYGGVIRDQKQFDELGDLLKDSARAILTSGCM